MRNKGVPAVVDLEDTPGLMPRLRFAEFREAGKWDKDTLGRLSLFISERIALDKLSLATYVSTDNILPDYEGLLPASKLPPSGMATRFKANDVLISNIRPYLKKVCLAGKDGGASADVIVVREERKVIYQFLSSVLRNDAFIKYVMRGAKGVKMPRGDISLMKDYPVSYPSKPEQQKIADCLSSLDDLITLGAQKLDTLKVHKKGLMQQLFPAEGETVPRLRFAEFRDAGEWILCDLGSKTTKVGSGITPNGGDKNYNKVGRPFIRSQNIGWGQLLLSDVAFIDDATHNSFVSTEIHNSDVLLNITGASIGRSAVADLRIVGGNVNQHVCIIRLKQKELSPALLNHYLLSQYGQQQVDSFQAGGNRQGLNFAQVRSFSIPIPPAIEEQIRVATCLSSLDDLITSQSKKVDTLKLHKKGLMQQLFPVLDEAAG